MQSRTKEIVIAAAAFLAYNILLSEYVMPSLFQRQLPAAAFGWLSLVPQIVAVAILIRLNHRSAGFVGLISLILQLLIQIVGALFFTQTS